MPPLLSAQTGCCLSSSEGEKFGSSFHTNRRRIQELLSQRREVLVPPQAIKPCSQFLMHKKTSKTDFLKC